MNDKVLKIIVYITGFVCLFIFISVRFLPLYNTLQVEKLVPHYWDKTMYGELYYFNYINHFKEKNMPPAGIKHQLSPNQPDINEAEVFAFGDSFFDIVRPVQFPTLLSQKLHKKVYFGYNDYPLQYLNQNSYHDTTPKIMVMGIVERYFHMKFSKKPDTSFVRKPANPKVIEVAKKVKDMIFYKKGEELYDVLLKRSYLTSGIYSEIATLKFDLFGYVSRYTPVYTLNDTLAWLFKDDSVNDKPTSFYYKHSQAEIDNMCDNLKMLSDNLLKIYNIKFVFLPIPGQYTMYHSKLNNHHYNNLIPAIQKGLSERNVAYIDLYSEFKNSNKLLYFGTDGHWNENGLRLAVELTVRHLKERNLLASNSHK